MLNRIATELKRPIFYIDDEKFMMLLRAVPLPVLYEWYNKYIGSESDDDLDTRDANGSVLSVDINSVYPN